MSTQTTPIGFEAHDLAEALGHHMGKPAVDQLSNRERG